VFLDRDGVLNRKPREGDYVKHWGEFAWLPGALDALRRLHEAGALLVVITNQQGVAKGVMKLGDVNAIHERLRILGQLAGAPLAGIYVCPHREGTCKCRKPALGLFRAARKDMPQISFKHSVVVGDSASDVEAGQKLGAKTVLIGTPGRGEPKPDAQASSLVEAADKFILPLLRG
jgi:histidinol-phosphate phosphatase family protein